MFYRVLLSVCVLLLVCAWTPGVVSNSAGVGIPCDIANPILGTANRQRDTNRAMWWTTPPQFAGTKYTLRAGNGPTTTTDLTSYTPGQYTELTILANQQDQQFTGLLMYAENAQGQKVGEWIMPPRQPFHVDYTSGCVTHTNADPKHYKSVFRVKFPAGTGRVTIKALVKYGLAFPAMEGAFYWPNSAHLVLNEGAQTAQTWYQGKVGQSCNQVCAEKSLSCNLDVLRSGGSASLYSSASRVGTCFAPMMRACGSGAPATGTQGCFYQDPTCTRASQQTTWVQTDTCADVPACAQNTAYDKACCSYQGFKWCSKSYTNGFPQERQYGQWTRLGACAPAGGWPSTPLFPNPAPRAAAQADCSTVKTSNDDGARLCACGNGGPVVTDAPIPQQPQPQTTTQPSQQVTQPPQVPTTTRPPQTTAQPTQTQAPATRPPTARPTIPPPPPPPTLPPSVRPPITPPPPTNPPPIVNPENAQYVLRLTSGGVPSVCWNAGDGFATGVFNLGMALSANGGSSWEFMNGKAGLPSVTVTFKQPITAKQGGGWNTANSRTTGPNSWTFDLRQYQPSVGLILSWNAPASCVNGRFSPEPSFSVSAAMGDGTPVLVDGSLLASTGYTSLSALSSSVRAPTPQEGPVAAYHGATFGTLNVRNAVQSIQLETSPCWIGNSGLVNAQVTFSIRQTDSTSPLVPHVPKTETGLPRVTITFPEVSSLDVTNAIQVDNSVSNDISWSFDEKSGQGVVGGVFQFSGVECEAGQLTTPLVYTIAARADGVVFPTTSTSVGFAATALNELGSPDTSSSSSSSSSSNIALIIGAVAGAVVLVTLVAVVICVRQRRTKQQTRTTKRVQMEQIVTTNNNNNNRTNITPTNPNGVVQWV